MNFYSPAQDIYDRIDSVEIELSDIDSEIEMQASKIESDPSRLEFVRERINLIYSLEQKHNVETVDELLGIQQDMKLSVTNIESMDEELFSLKTRLSMLKKSLDLSAGGLSTRREASLKGIEENVVRILNRLGIPNANFRVKQSRFPEPGPKGKDHIDFLFTANKNSALQDLKKVASGGELSRVMLSLKSLINESLSLPTIIFDEIDSGVSGDIADRMGEIIYGMSSNMQVVNITHLPQIASKGGRHYLVYKSDDDSATHTMIKLLSEEDRVMEIAKMLSGKEMSKAAIENARVLLNSPKV